MRPHKELEKFYHHQTLILTTNSLQSKFCEHPPHPLGEREDRATQAHRFSVEQLQQLF